MEEGGRMRREEGERGLVELSYTFWTRSVSKTRKERGRGKRKEVFTFLICAFLSRALRRKERKGEKEGGGRGVAHLF